jgi:hypothetical protein
MKERFTGIGGMYIAGHLYNKTSLKVKNSLNLLATSKSPFLSEPFTI